MLAVGYEVALELPLVLEHLAAVVVRTLDQADGVLVLHVLDDVRLEACHIHSCSIVAVSCGRRGRRRRRGRDAILALVAELDGFVGGGERDLCIGCVI